VTKNREEKEKEKRKERKWEICKSGYVQKQIASETKLRRESIFTSGKKKFKVHSYV
jgi:hypothetical protein